MSQFNSIFKSLTTPSESQAVVIVYNGREVENYRGCHVGKDQFNRPAVLFATQSNHELVPPSISIENLRVEHGIECQLSLANGRRVDGKFSVVSCISSDRSLQEYFLETMEIVTSSLPPIASARDVANSIERLIELFQVLRRTPRGTTMGLWAELFVIMSSADPRAMIQAWHSDANERFDFSAGLQRIEVKSAGDRIRDHYFSFEQAYPPDDVDVIIMSIFVESSTNGKSLGELWDEARAVAGSNGELRMKIERLCLDALGASWSDARMRSFDYQLAKQSLSFYNVRDIPRVSERQPNEVTDIRFRSDITAIRPIDIATYRGTGLLFDACFGNEENATNVNY